MVNQVVQQAKAAVEPVIERNPDVFDHLAAAGHRTARRLPLRGRGARSGAGPTATRTPRASTASGRDEGTGPGEHIDLD